MQIGDRKSRRPRQTRYGGRPAEGMGRATQITRKGASQRRSEPGSRPGLESEPVSGKSVSANKEAGHGRKSHHWRPAPAAGVEAYQRARFLPRLIAATPADIADTGIERSADLLRRLRRALQRERHLGRIGHWTYDLNRHIALVQAVGAESSRLKELMAAGKPTVGFGPDRIR